MDFDYSEFTKAYNQFNKWDDLDNLNPIVSNEVDRVNHPSHYTSGSQEAIDTIEDAVKDAPDAVLGGLQWNALKYLLRLWLKHDNPKKDALKARWYLNRLIDKL